MCGFAGVVRSRASKFLRRLPEWLFLEIRYSLLDPRRAVSLCTIPSLSLGTVMAAARHGPILLQDAGLLVAIAAVISPNLTWKSYQEEQSTTLQWLLSYLFRASHG
jgi:hypothetical protein